MWRILICSGFCGSQTFCPNKMLILGHTSFIFVHSAAFFFLYWHWLRRLGLDGRSFGLHFLAGAKVLLFSLFPWLPLRLIHPPIPVGVGLSSGVKWAGPWKWQLTSMKRQDQEYMALHLHFCHVHGNSDAPRYVLFSFKWYFMPAVWDYY